MGCKVSKSRVESHALELLGCNKLSRSYSSPSQVVDGEHPHRYPKSEVNHVVSLTSSTYGSLRLDSLPRSVSREDVKPYANQKCVETARTWRLSELFEDEKETSQTSWRLMEKSRFPGHDNRMASTFHTVEDVDSVLDARRSGLRDHRLRKVTSMEEPAVVKSHECVANFDEMSTNYYAMTQKQRAQAMQGTEEARELEYLRRANPSRSREVIPTNKSRGFRSQELGPERKNNISRSQELGPERKNNISRSQEFARPPVVKSLLGATRRSLDESEIFMSQPDLVLRSPMLKGLVGLQRPRSRSIQQSSMSSDVSSERRSQFLLQGHAQPVVEKTTTFPRNVDSSKVSLNFSSTDKKSRNGHQRTGKVLEPRVASAVAALSRPREQKSSVTVQDMPERKTEVFQDQPFNLTKTNYGAPKISEHGLGATTAPQVKTQERQESVVEDAIFDDYEVVTKAEVIEAERLGSPPLDPELLASFEEALELFCADDWCTVRLGEGEAAVTSGNISDLDSPSWLRDSPEFPDYTSVRVKLNKFEILEDHMEKPQSRPELFKKVLPLKVGSVDTEEQKMKTNVLGKDEKCPPGGKERCVLYTTSLRGIRKTFEDCSQLRTILQNSNVQIDERDIAMHAEFRHELSKLVGRAAPVPRLFIRGKYIGGREEVSQLHEDGILSTLLKDLPKQGAQAVCDGCGGIRFIPCLTCSGSCKVITEEGKFTFCKECNENGLRRCPICL